MDRTPAHGFDSLTDATFTADFRHRATGQVSTWEIVLYAGFDSWKPRNLTTRLHRTCRGEQYSYGSAQVAISDTEQWLERFNHERLTPWTECSTGRKVA